MPILIGRKTPVGRPIACLLAASLCCAAAVPSAAGARQATNATLAPDGVIGGVIGGTVHDDGFATLAYGVQVQLARFQNGNWESVESAVAQAPDGHFQFVGLAEGSYVLSALSPAFAPGYDPELYQDVPCPSGGCSGVLASGTPIVLGLGQVVDGIDIGLNPGASIAGHVSDQAGGAALAGVDVTIYASLQVEFGVYAYHAVQSALTDANGDYVLTHLAPGDAVYPYHVNTFNRAGYLDQYFQGLVCGPTSCSWDSADNVALAQDQAIAGFDFVLAKAGGFSGAARSVDESAPVAGAVVRIHEANGIEYRAESTGFVTTGNDGAYATFGLPDGTYYAVLIVAAGPYAGLHVHGGPSCPDGSSPDPCNHPAETGATIVIAGGVAQTNVDFLVSDGDVLFKSGFE